MLPNYWIVWRIFSLTKLESASEKIVSKEGECRNCPWDILVFTLNYKSSDFDEQTTRCEEFIFSTKFNEFRFAHRFMENTFFQKFCSFYKFKIMKKTVCMDALVVKQRRKTTVSQTFRLISNSSIKIVIIININVNINSCYLFTRVLYWLGRLSVYECQKHQGWNQFIFNTAELCWSFSINFVDLLINSFIYANVRLHNFALSMFLLIPLKICKIN